MSLIRVEIPAQIKNGAIKSREKHKTARRRLLRSNTKQIASPIASLERPSSWVIVYWGFSSLLLFSEPRRHRWSETPSSTSSPSTGGGFTAAEPIREPGIGGSHLVLGVAFFDCPTGLPTLYTFLSDVRRERLDSKRSQLERAATNRLDASNNSICFNIQGTVSN